MEENPNAGVPMYDADDILEYDEDGNPIIPEKSKFIDPLPPIDHSEVKGWIQEVYSNKDLKPWEDCISK